MTQVVVTFYKFVRLPDFAEKRDSLLSQCEAQGIKGTILLAAEGINGTIAGSRQAIDAVLSFLRSDPVWLTWSKKSLLPILCHLTG
jgi:UPF0176 protein